MDRMIYTAMTGLKHAMKQQATTSHNLANATTTGFRAQLDIFRAVPVVSEGKPTRAFVVDSTVGADFTVGAISHTERPYDIAIKTKGWFAVQMPDGSEAYTRHGSFDVAPNGLLQTKSGLPVLDIAGAPVAIPPDVRLIIGRDGSIATIDEATSPKTVTNVTQLKLVNPPEKEMIRGDDTLFRRRDGAIAEADENVVVVQGALESSNVNVADTLVSLISVARHFDAQMGILKNAESNAARATQILSLST